MRFSCLVSKWNVYLQIGKRNIELYFLIIWFVVGMPLVFLLCLFLIFLAEGSVNLKILISGLGILGFGLPLSGCFLSELLVDRFEILIVRES